MIAGVLVSLVLVLLHCPQAASLPAARAVAFGTIAMGIGGSMTYGQTIGLTQNPEVIGNWEAWRWGMLGLGIKGAIWIGFAGLFLGMGLGGQRYSGRDVFRLMLGIFALYAAGWWMLNQPFEPANRILPRVYFSASWRWQPEAGDALRPRPEVWGGLLFALIGAWAWAAWARGDRLARNLTLWGMVGGLGFPIGQCLQSWHAWNRDLFTTGTWATFDPVMNWWNWMETTFGAIMGASLGLGVWLNRSRIEKGRNLQNSRDAELMTRRDADHGESFLARHGPPWPSRCSSLFMSRCSLSPNSHPWPGRTRSTIRVSSSHSSRSSRSQPVGGGPSSSRCQ